MYTLPSRLISILLATPVQIFPLKIYMSIIRTHPHVYSCFVMHAYWLMTYLGFVAQILWKFVPSIFTIIILLPLLERIPHWIQGYSLMSAELISEWRASEEFVLQDEGWRVHSCNNSLCKRQIRWTCSPDCASVPHDVIFVIKRAETADTKDDHGWGRGRLGSWANGPSSKTL